MTGDKAAGWMSPDEYLLILPYGETAAAMAAIAAALKGAHHLAVVVSDARAVFRVEGAKADQVLAKLSPVDFATLGPKELRRTRAAQVAAAFWKEGDGFTLVCFRSVAGYVFDFCSIPLSLALSCRTAEFTGSVELAGPQIAFVTMVRDEPFFLPLWVDYYSRFVARTQLFVVIDGFDQALPDCLNGCQVLRLPRAEVRPGWDEARWNMLSSFANTLLGRFDIVVLNDVDELVVLDPAQGDDLVGALAEAQHIGVISPFAIELVHRTDLEPSALGHDGSADAIRRCRAADLRAGDSVGTPPFSGVRRD